MDFRKRDFKTTKNISETKKRDFPLPGQEWTKDQVKKAIEITRPIPNEIENEISWVDWFLSFSFLRRN